MKLNLQEENVILLGFVHRLSNELIESIVVNERVFTTLFFEKESTSVVKYVFDCTTAIRSLTVKTVFGDYTINEREDNTKAFELISRYLNRISTINASYYHGMFMKILTD